jgi:hypothetical protein
VSRTGAVTRSRSLPSLRPSILHAVMRTRLTNVLHPVVFDRKEGGRAPPRGEQDGAALQPSGLPKGDRQFVAYAAAGAAVRPRFWHVSIPRAEVSSVRRQHLGLTAGPSPKP